MTGGYMTVLITTCGIFIYDDYINDAYGNANLCSPLF